MVQGSLPHALMINPKRTPTRSLKASYKDSMMHSAKLQRKLDNGIFQQTEEETGTSPRHLHCRWPGQSKNAKHPLGFPELYDGLGFALVINCNLILILGMLFNSAQIKNNYNSKSSG